MKIYSRLSAKCFARAGRRLGDLRQQPTWAPLWHRINPNSLDVQGHIDPRHLRPRSSSGNIPNTLAGQLQHARQSESYTGTYGRVPLRKAMALVLDANGTAQRCGFFHSDAQVLEGANRPRQCGRNSATQEWECEHVTLSALPSR